MEIFDAIIIGAGPAGLSIASELSKKKKVLVIEAKDGPDYPKAWATWKQNLRFVPKEAILHKSERSVFRAKSGSTIILPGELQ